MNYYNENDKKAAAWLRELITAGHIPKGEVDERSIADVQPADLVRFTQCHFFAGIGGWSLALRLAGWPEDKPVYTGSCPCQPFSCAGKGLGESDERHLWPDFYRLIGARKPAIVFGEQVASAAGRLWLDGIRTDLEALAYEVGAADLCAAGISAPHIRQRLFWMANAPGRGLRIDGSAPRCAGHIDQCGTAGRLAESKGDERDRTKRNGDATGRGGLANGCRLEQSDSNGRGAGQSPAESARHRSSAESASGLGWMGEPIQPGLEGHAGNGNGGNQSGRLDQESNGPIAETGANGGRVAESNDTERRPNSSEGNVINGGHARREKITGDSGECGAWSNFGLIPCRDGKQRRIESGTFPLAHGIPGRVGLLRGYGNAIVPELAAEFIQACVEAISEIEAITP